MFCAIDLNASSTLIDSLSVAVLLSITCPELLPSIDTPLAEEAAFDIVIYATVSCCPISSVAFVVFVFDWCTLLAEYAQLSDFGVYLLIVSPIPTAVPPFVGSALSGDANRSLTSPTNYFALLVSYFCSWPMASKFLINCVLSLPSVSTLASNSPRLH